METMLLLLRRKVDSFAGREDRNKVPRAFSVAAAVGTGTDWVTDSWVRSFDALTIAWASCGLCRLWEAVGFGVLVDEQ